MSNTREVTNKLIESVESGSLSWEAVARECLQRMSEQEVDDMARECEFVTEEETVFCPRCGNEELQEELMEHGGRKVCMTCYDDLDSDMEEADNDPL